MAQWSVVHRVFAYDAFVKNNDSIDKVQRAFRHHFKVGRRDAVPNRKTIMRCVDSLIDHQLENANIIVMTYKTVMLLCLITMFLALAKSKSQFPLLQPIRHEPRFSNLEVTNKYSLVQGNASFNQYNAIQYADFHYIYYDSVYIGRINIEIMMCKEYFIDCSNLRTFDITDICLKGSTAIDQWNTVQELNRGPYARRMLEDSKTQDERALLDDTSKGFEDLKCSYLYRMLLHLKLTGELVIRKPSVVAKTNIPEVTFWNESLQILEFMHHNHVDETQSTIRISHGELSIFWIFVMYTERVKKYTAEDFADNEEANKSLTIIHTAVTGLLEEYSKDCKVYDQISGLPLEGVSILDKINDRVSTAIDPDSKITLIGENKNEFKRQVDHNKELIIPLHDKCKHSLRMSCMHLNNVHKSDDDMTLLIQHLGMFDKKSQKSFVKKLRESFEFTMSTTAPLYRQIEVLQQVQKVFIDVIKAVAVRISLKHLSYMKKMVHPHKHILHDNESQANAMHATLKVVFDYLNLDANNDTVMPNVIESCNGGYVFDDRIDAFIRRTTALLGHIKRDIPFELSSSINLNTNVPRRFIAPLSKYVANKHLVKAANRYGIETSTNDFSSALDENILRGKILNEFLRKNFHCSDFYFISSYISIIPSVWVDKLEYFYNKMKKGDQDAQTTQRLTDK
ncbi:uncharacterized protein LOC126840402 [Adelges cooleyi]|uniref:uncharacterized protein LOC126840402 n=1 Tax=Adelges cooleyi TaxID=133065 RepID=UPI00217FD31B|nr:uncharacterized protein LOC126840402 [Adelges cooleyi]